MFLSLTLSSKKYFRSQNRNLKPLFTNSDLSFMSGLQECSERQDTYTQCTIKARATKMKTMYHQLTLER